MTAAVNSEFRDFLRLITLQPQEDHQAQGEQWVLPEFPREADFRHLSNLLRQNWSALPARSQEELHRVALQAVSAERNPLLLAGFNPRIVITSYRAFMREFRARREEGATWSEAMLSLKAEVDASSLGMMRLWEEVLSLWEDHHPELQARLSLTLQERENQRGKAIRSKEDVRAALDELF